MLISLSRAQEIVASFARQHVLVVGDLMLDRYIVGTVDRISPEAPVPVVRVGQERNMAGGAANVAMNIRSLGGQVSAAGVVGRDLAGRELMGVMHRAGIGTQGVAVLDGVRTTLKTRIIAEHQQVVRVDWEDPLRLTPPALRRFCAGVASAMRGVTAAAIDDYDKGVIGQEVVEAVLNRARQQRIPVGFDPKRNHGLDVRGISLATPNAKEAFEAAGLESHAVGPRPEDDPQLRRAADILLRRWAPQQLIITLGGHGMYLASRKRPPRVIPTKAREVYDVSGAGDTVIAACVLAVAAGADYYEAAVIGNYAAGVVVGKLGTATCSTDELLAAIQDDERLGA